MGNHYLKWAFTQAVTIAKRSGPFKKYADRLTAKHGKSTANAIMAHRLGRAVYFMLRNRDVFDIKKMLKGKIDLGAA